VAPRLRKNVARGTQAPNDARRRRAGAGPMGALGREGEWGGDAGPVRLNRV